MDHTFDEKEYKGHYDSTYGSTGNDYNDYLPAYRYGYDIANHPDYRGRDWTDFESEAREDWENEHDTAWDDVKDAVQHAWNEVKDAFD